MIKNTYRLQLNTPAFLGDAAQKGAWRTPPLKALLREWWRITVAPTVGYGDVRALKNAEADLFGTAADDGGKNNQQSKIRFSLRDWREGTLTDWSKVNPAERGRLGSDPQVKHREVQFGNQMVGSQLYLGYGPLLLDKGNPAPKLKNGAALQANEENVLKLAFPDVHAETLSTAVALAHWFGTIGGRSRNGWGSLGWQAQGQTQALTELSRTALENTGCIRPLASCLQLDWPHAIGMDKKGPLVWRSEQSFANWRDAMKFLAQTKIDFRIALGFTTGDNSPKVEPRHLVAYPVTKHHVGSWGRNARLANTLRFKLEAEAGGRSRALIYHTPCRPSLRHEGVDPFDTWQRVHQYLDANSQLTRLA